MSANASVTDAEVSELVQRSLSARLQEKGMGHVVITPSTQIFGSGSVIDSLDLVGVIVEIEEGIFSKSGKRIEVVDESSVISDDSPFKTVHSLTNLILKKIREQ